MFQSYRDGADLDEGNSTQGTCCDTQRLPVLPDECGQKSQSGAALTGASDQGNSTTQKIVATFRSGTVNSRTTLNIHDILNTSG